MSGPHSIFRGSITALPTPFEGGSIDFGALVGLVERQIAGGTSALVVGGSTGEASTLCTRERKSLFEFVAGVARGRVPVIAGVGSSDTRVACELARDAKGAGASGLLVTTPPYSRPTQEGLRRHFAAVAAASPLPLALYNIPGRTGVDLVPATVAAIAAENSTVVAIKEASDSLERLRELAGETDVVVLCGEDRWIADAMELGAAGVIGVVSNLVPELVARVVACYAEGGERGDAPALMETFAPLTRALGLETNPAPLKAALEELGLARGELRLPLVPVSSENRGTIRSALAAIGLGG